MSSNTKKYNIKPGNGIRWLIVGNNREYFLNEYSCPCKSFQLLVSKKSYGECKHIIQLRKSIVSGNYDSIDISIPEYQKLRKYLINYKT